MNKAIFLDKDGTLIKNVPYNVDPKKIKLYPDVPEALRLLNQWGFKIVIITNQPGVAHGYFKEKDLKEVKSAIRNQLTIHDISMDGFYYCPHHTEGKIKMYTRDCSCRKPKPGMIIKAACELNIDLSRSWMIGDILNDVEAGNRAGCKTILIDNGNETEWEMSPVRIPLYTVKKISEAAVKIINEYEKRNPVKEGRFL